MGVKTWVKGLVSVTALLAAGVPVHARQQSSSQQAGSDPVADAARKAREDKKNAAKPKKVYTDDDVKPAAVAPAENRGSNAAADLAAGQQRGSEAGVAEDPNGEAAWRRKFKEQHDKIAKAEIEISLLQRELQKAQVEYYPDPQKALSEQNNRKEVNDKRAKIEAKTQEIAQLKQGLDDLEDQLRKSGGDPGWAR